MKKVLLTSLIGVLLILCLAPSVPSAAESEVVYNDEVTSDFNITFKVTYFENMSIRVQAENEARYSRESFYSVSFGLTEVVYQNVTLAPGQSKTYTHDLSEYPDPEKAQQNVLFAIIGPNIEYTYNRTTNADDTGEVLMAKISEVSVEPALDGNGTELVVTVTDPSPHAYTKTLVVYSRESHRIYGYPMTGKNRSDTVRIPLNEQRGELVEGEIRLYSGDTFEENSTMDMVTFQGRTNGSTSSEEVEFERIDDPGNYYYGMENDSTEDDLAVTSDGDVTNLGIAAGMLGAGALALLSMFAVGVRRKLG
ncbi:hypothetical protein [Haloparvum sp. PAK95]|uniref:hypothetical protein n=1 Tax=Haloparvum sp. PAK95 TaxID=3418962 RepID=UPI003D2ECBA3